MTNHEGIIERIASNLDDLYIITQIPENTDVTSQQFSENPLVVVLAPMNHPLANKKYSY